MRAFGVASVPVACTRYCVSLTLVSEYPDGAIMFEALSEATGFKSAPAQAPSSHAGQNEPIDLQHWSGACDVQSVGKESTQQTSARGRSA